jgi:CheY-like chemotaxis protein
MIKKNILIVDDEISILTVLKSSLKKLDTACNVFTTTNGEDAFKLMKNQKFDLVITDYKMAGMDGLELIAAVRSIRPETRMILMTAYGDNAVQEETRRLQAYRYLTKPLEINDFRQTVQEAIDSLAVSRPGILILSDERYTQIVNLLNQLKMDVGARCVVLADSEGCSIAHVGNTDEIPLAQIIPLLGGSITGISEVGRALDGEQDAVNLVYRESETQDLYVINIGMNIQLIIIIDRTAFNNRLGLVWYAAKQIALTLVKKLGQAEYTQPADIFNQSLDQALVGEMDKLFLESSFSAMEETPTSEIGSEYRTDLGREYSEPISKLTSQSNLPMPVLLTYEDAVGAGIVSCDLASRPIKDDMS